MYAFDGYSTPIRNVVVGACFPSIALSDFYSVRIRTYVHNLYTAGKPTLRPIQQWYFYLEWCTTPEAVGWMYSDDTLIIQTPLLPFLKCSVRGYRTTADIMSHPFRRFLSLSH